MEFIVERSKKAQTSDLRPQTRWYRCTLYLQSRVTCKHSSQATEEKEKNKKQKPKKNEWVVHTY
jgi:hypothetical protein